MVIYPGDWEEMRLSDIGYTYSGLTGKTKADFETGNGKFITFLNVLNNIKIDIKILGRVNIRENERQNAVRVGDLFFNTSSETPEEVGMCAVLLDEPGICYLNSFCFGYHLKRKDINPLFLSYYFNSGVGREFMRIHAQGSTRYNMSKQSFLKQSIHIPPLKEQTAIADTLAAFDTHITNLTELITKKKAIRDGALDELMTGRTRLKGFCGDWEVKTLGEVCKIFDGTHQTPKYTSTGIKFVSVENIRDIYKSEKYISIDDYHRDFKIYPQKGDILMTRIGDIGTPCIVSQDEPIAYYVSLALLKDISINNAYLYYYIQGRAFQKELYDRTLHHATPKKINKGEIGKCLVIIPPLDEQIAIADTLSALDKEISSLETERAKISSIRDGAINDLLTGKVRLNHGI